jgi:hypothetical protein
VSAGKLAMNYMKKNTSNVAKMITKPEEGTIA